MSPYCPILPLLIALGMVPALARSVPNRQSPIDRHALVTRHNVTLTAFDGSRPVQVGNGEFAFGMDITGLQTFVPFNTMSQWGWHSSPLPAGQRIEDFQGEVWDTHGRPIRYPMDDPKHPELSAWLAANPHRINLGRVGLEIKKQDGSLAAASDLLNPQQKLDLWTGIVTSRFEVEGEPVTVTTACHPSVDAVAVHIESPLVKEGRMAVFLDCPGNDGLQFANFVGDSTELSPLDPISPVKDGRADFERHIDNDSYRVSLTWQGNATLAPPKVPAAPPIEIVRAEYGAETSWIDVKQAVASAVHDGHLRLRVGNGLGGDPILSVPKSLKVEYVVDGQTQTATAKENELLILGPAVTPHGLVLQPGPASEDLSFVCAFASKAVPRALPDAETTFAACRRAWPAFWKSGGAIDLSRSRDPRWHELERRIVLSQYLMKVNEAGSLPPQESGLVNNGWYGRFHMEMYWWHAAHWALWNRWGELRPSLSIYTRLLPTAEKRAGDEGYLGARWPKCIGPNFVEWPHPIHSFLIWQQPHPMFFAELDYRAHPARATLDKWRSVVEETADFLASYAFYDKASGRYVLGPPLHLVSENTDPFTTMNPTFELSYWRFGLRVAQEWRTRLGLSRKPEWDKVIAGLSPLPQQHGLYVLHEGVKDMWTKFNFEHPALTGAFGMLPGDGVDVPTMRRTLDKVVSTWNFGRTWGWDFPMLAMCAARLGEPDRAVDFLLTQEAGFQFDARGLATGGPFPYFPSNGGLLYAVAMMAAGWTGGPKTHAPGFPSSGQWNVRYENLSPAP
jgi:hypothetical protein